MKVGRSIDYHRNHPLLSHKSKSEELSTSPGECSQTLSRLLPAVVPYLSRSTLFYYTFLGRPRPRRLGIAIGWASVFTERSEETFLGRPRPRGTMLLEVELGFPVGACAGDWLSLPRKGLGLTAFVRPEASGESLPALACSE